VSNAAKNSGGSIPLWIACYALWFGFSGLGLWLLIQLRVNLIDLAYVLGLGDDATANLHNFALLVFAILYIVFVVVVEHHLRLGVMRGELWRRAAGVLFVLFVMLGLSYGFQQVVLN
jgi:TRAP-type C4-dicarboxylate transport system permease small subunit